MGSTHAKLHAEMIEYLNQPEPESHNDYTGKPKLGFTWLYLPGYFFTVEVT